jgi:hypothetical protein
MLARPRGRFIWIVECIPGIDTLLERFSTVEQDKALIRGWSLGWDDF